MCISNACSRARRLRIVSERARVAARIHAGTIGQLHSVVRVHPEVHAPITLFVPGAKFMRDVCDAALRKAT